jgi:hypothetical protein
MRRCRGEVKKKKRVSVDSFMKELLPPSQYDIIHGSYPRFWHVVEKTSFNETFLNYDIWFDHAIKVKKENTLSRAPLEVYHGRGDGVVRK